VSRREVAIAVSLAVVAAAARAPLWILVPVLVLAGGIGMSWNGLSFVSAAEIAGPASTGGAIGLQQTMLGVAAIVSPIVFGAVVSSTAWALAFLVAAALPIVGRA